MHGQLGSFLESPAAAQGMTVDQPALPERPGTIIGPYKLHGLVGAIAFVKRVLRQCIQRDRYAAGQSEGRRAQKSILASEQLYSAA